MSWPSPNIFITDREQVFEALPEHVLNNMGILIKHLVHHGSVILCTTADFEVFADEIVIVTRWEAHVSGYFHV